MSNNNMAGTLPSTIGVLTNLQYDVCELCCSPKAVVTHDCACSRGRVTLVLQSASSQLQWTIRFASWHPKPVDQLEVSAYHER